MVTLLVGDIGSDEPADLGGRGGVRGCSDSAVVCGPSMTAEEPTDAAVVLVI